VRRIARNSWRVKRAALIQDGTAAHEVLKLELERAVAGENLKQRLEDGLAAIDALLEMNRNVNFSDLRAFDRAYNSLRNFYQGELPVRLGEIYDRVYRLSANLQRRSRVASPRTPSAPGQICADLTQLLEAERADLYRWEAIYRLQHVEIMPTERLARMGPVQPHAPAMVRQEESLARQVERDVRYLLDLKEREERKSREEARASQAAKAPEAKPPRSASDDSLSNAGQSSQTDAA